MNIIGGVVARVKSIVTDSAERRAYADGEQGFFAIDNWVVGASTSTMAVKSRVI